MNASINKVDKKLIHTLIGLFLMLFLWNCPPVGNLTSTGMQLVGLFIGTVYLWTTVEILWPSLLCLAVLMLTDIGTTSSVLVASFGNTTVILMIFILALTGAIEEAGVYNYIAQWIISLKIINGRPWVFTFVILLGTYLLGILCGFVAAFFFWSVIYTVCDLLKIEKTSTWSKLMLFSIGCLSFMASYVMPFQGMALVCTGTIISIIPDFQLNFPGYFICINAINLSVILIWTICLKFVFRPDVSTLKKISSDFFASSALPPMSKTQKYLLFHFVFTMVLMFMPTLLPQGTFLAKNLTSLGSLGICIVMFCPLFLIKQNGKPVANFKSLAGNKITWDLIFLCASAIALSGFLTNAETGVNITISALLTPLLAGKSELFFIAIVCFITLLLTNITNNGVVAVLVLTLSTMLCGDIDPAILLLLVAFTSNIAFFLPASSMVSAIIYGNEYLKPKDIYLYSLVIIFISFLVAILVGYPLGRTLL